MSTTKEPIPFPQPGKRKPRGRPFAPGNTSGRGRPKGSLNQTTLLAREIFAMGGKAGAAKLLEMAQEGHPAAMRLAMKLLCPARKPFPADWTMPPMSDPDEVRAGYLSVLKAVHARKLTLTEANHALNRLARKARTLNMKFYPPWKPDTRVLIQRWYELGMDQPRRSEGQFPQIRERILV